jgi:F0F1-type ATP synthase delta subunit
MSDVQLSISNEIVKPIVEAKIQAAIISELEKSADVIESMVSKALTDSCNEKGQKDQYSSYNKFTFIERCCYTAVQEQAKEALKQYLENNRQKLFDAMKKQISKRVDDIACAFADSMIEHAKSQYGFTVELKVQEKKPRY